jgi:hypothetical protein
MRLTFARLAVVLASVLATAPVAAAQEDAPYAPIAGDWEHHGFGITVNDDGTSTADWRVYQWCGPGIGQPCDQIVNNRIISGGHADIAFSGPDDGGAFQGQVMDSSDSTLLNTGPLTLTPQQYDMALLEQGDTQIVLCGSDAANEAPRDVLEQCGA